MLAICTLSTALYTCDRHTGHVCLPQAWFPYINTNIKLGRSTENGPSAWFQRPTIGNDGISGSHPQTNDVQRSPRNPDTYAPTSRDPTQICLE